MTKVEASPMHVCTQEWAAMLARWYGSADKAITALNQRQADNRSWLYGALDDDRDRKTLESREDVLGQLALMAVAE